MEKMNRMTIGKDWKEMASRNDWKDMMSSVPEERKKVYLRVREKLGIVFEYPISETKKALDIIVAASFEPGTRTVAGIKYEWRLARMPYYGMLLRF